MGGVLSMVKKITFSDKDIEKIKNLYTNKKISTEKIALIFEVSPQTITRLLKKQRISFFPQGFFNKGRIPHNKILFSKKQEREIVDMVHNKRMSSTKISKLFNCSEFPILKILKKYNVRFVREKKSPKIMYNGKTRKEFYGETSERMKNNNPMKRKEVVIKMSNTLKKRYSIGMIKSKKKNLNIYKIKKMYLDEEKSCKQIGELLGVSIGTIQDRLKREGINIQRIGKERNRKRIQSSHPWNYRLKGFSSEWNIGIKRPELVIRNKINNPLHNPIHKKTWLKSLNLKPNTPEKFLIELFNKNNFNLKYVGNGKRWFNLKYFDGEMDRKKMFNPDFINEEKKAIVELFGDYWHNNKKAIINDNLRIKTYLSRGYKVLIIWEHELIGGKYGEKKEISKILQTTKDFLNHSPPDYTNYPFFYSGVLSMSEAKDRYAQETKIFEKVCNE